MKHFPKSLELRGIFPLGYFLKNASADVMDAFPLMEVKELKSQDGVM